MKRSAIVTLALLGSVAACGASRQPRCPTDDAGQRSECRTSGSGRSSGHSGGARSRQEVHGKVIRGGFGATGSGFSGGHGSGS